MELTSLNRPEGRVFDWLFEPMSIMKEQIRSLKLVESEELYLYKLCLYGEIRQEWKLGTMVAYPHVKRSGELN